MNEPTPCKHSDRFCPCNDSPDASGCHYEPMWIDGRLSPASPCRNPVCPVCHNDLGGDAA